MTGPGEAPGPSKGGFDSMGKTALILSGGGSRGAYQIGVWQALRELGEPIQMVVGASVGALNGAMVAQGDFDAAWELWRKVETTKVFDLPLDEGLPLNRKRAAALRLFGKAAVSQGGAGTQALTRLLSNTLDEEKIRASSVRLGLVTVELGGMKPHQLWIDQIPQGKLVDYLVASSSLFPAIRPHQIGGKLFIDGGYQDNLPCRLALKGKPDRLIVVHLEAPGRLWKVDGGAKCQLVLIDPYWDLGDVLLFDPERSRKNMRLGYLDAMRAFHVYDGRAFAFVKGTLRLVGRRYYQRFYQAAGLVGLESLRHHFLESVAYSAVEKRVFRRGIPASSTLRGFALAGMECAGEIFGMDPCLLYDLERFQERLKERVWKTKFPESLARKASGPPEQWLAALTGLLEAATPPVRAKFLASCIRGAMAHGKGLNLLPAATLLTDEFCAGMYLALSGLTPPPPGKS